MCDEFDLILGEGTCKRFREKWLIAVPIILELARSSTTASVKKILESYSKHVSFGILINISRKFLTANDCFCTEENSCAALEVLPLLVGGKICEESRRFLIDVREVM